MKDFTQKDRDILQETANAISDLNKDTSELAKRVSEPSKAIRFIYKIIEPLFWIGLVASFIFNLTGYHESAWTLMFITLINRQVMFEKYKTNTLKQ